MSRRIINHTNSISSHTTEHESIKRSSTLWRLIQQSDCPAPCFQPVCLFVCTHDRSTQSTFTSLKCVSHVDNTQLHKSALRSSTRAGYGIEWIDPIRFLAVNVVKVTKPGTVCPLFCPKFLFSVFYILELLRLCLLFIILLCILSIGSSG